jgi:hypothetical protein
MDRKESDIMNAGIKIARLIGGMLLVVVIIVATFALLRGWTPTWGATAAEVERVLPGDDLMARSPGDMTHAATIDALPEKVWPWIAQIGDDRGGFYSYTFIENLLQKAMLGGAAVYHNANRILPQLQAPQPGDGMIADSLQVYRVEAGKWLIATAKSESGEINWVWLWLVEPAGASQTRLIVRNRLSLPGGAGNLIASTVMDLGAFVMERRMIEGLRLRAEGGTEPAWIEIAEILLWLMALAAGFGAAVLFVTRPAWRASLLLGLASLFALIWFTFWQPAIWLRLLLNVALLGSLWWTARQGRRMPAASRAGQKRAPALGNA